MCVEKLSFGFVALESSYLYEWICETLHLVWSIILCVGRMGEVIRIKYKFVWVIMALMSVRIDSEMRFVFC